MARDRADIAAQLAREIGASWAAVRRAGTFPLLPTEEGDLFEKLQIDTIEPLIGLLRESKRHSRHLSG